MTKTNKSTPAADTETVLLTEDEIRQMGDKDYMNAAQLAFFKARLQQLEKDLLKNAGETTEHLRETVLVPDPADRDLVAGSATAPRAQAKAVRRLIGPARRDRSRRASGCARWKKACAAGRMLFLRTDFTNSERNRADPALELH